MRPINKEALERALKIDEEVSKPCYLSLYCLTYRGDDTNRRKDDSLSCKQCPVFAAGYCKECCDFIESLANKLRIRIEGLNIKADEKNWTGVKPEELIAFFDRVLNDGIINKKGEVNYKGTNHAKFSTWANAIFNRKRDALFALTKSDRLRVDILPTIDDDGNEISTEEEILTEKQNGLEGGKLPEDPYGEAVKGELKEVLLTCHDLIRKKDPKCADLMQLYSEQSLWGLENDDNYTIKKTKKLNESAVFKDLANKLGLSFEYIRSQTRKCKNKHQPRLQQCLRENGYGPMVA